MTPRRPDPSHANRPETRRADHHAGAPKRRGSQSARRGGPPAGAETRRRNLLLGGLGLVAVVAVGLIAMGMGVFGKQGSGTALPPNQGGANAVGSATAKTSGSVTPTVPTNVGAKPGGCPTSAPAALAKGETRTVTLATRKGQIGIQVKADLSPLAAGNFVALAECGFYNGVIFHRLVPGFVIQGGDRTGTGTGDPGYKIQDEPVTTAYKRGTVAMARTSAPNSQGAQFFIVLADTNPLAQTNTYAIFGTVTSGMEVVDAIAAMPNTGSPSNTARDPVAMDTVTVSTP